MRRTHRTAAAATAAAITLLTAGDGHADTVSGTRSELLVERGHEIRVKVDHGHATLTVRRTFYNGGERHDQAEVWIDIPDRSVATGLRTRGTLRGRPHWFDGELLEAEAAAARYRELTGIGGYYPKDPALLSWRDQSYLALQVFPVEPGAEKMVEYTLTIPAEYEEGRYRLWLPRLGTDERAATYVLEPAHRGDQLFVDDAPIVAGKRVTPSESGFALTLGRRDAPRLDGRLAVVPVSEGRVLVRFELDGARQFSRVPDDAHVVLAIDASRSRDDDAVRASISAARAYLQSLAAQARRPARVELLTFDRTVTRRSSGFESVERALARLDDMQVARGNGSDVDGALLRAAELLKAAPRGAPRRVVLISDLMARSSLDPRRARAIASSTGAVVHLGIVDDGGAALARDDDHDWASVARETGGVLWRGAAAAQLDAAAEREHVAVFEEWARPLRLDRVELRAPGLDLDAQDVPRVINEGDGLSWLSIEASRVRYVSIRGELWSEPTRALVLPSREHGDRWSALVFGSTLLTDLSEEEMMPLALRGGAVSPVTSYLAIEPGVRPSTEGLDWGVGSGVGAAFGAGGVGLGSGIRSYPHATPPDRQGFLNRALADAWRACGAGDRSASVALETTYQEVVDVTSVAINGAADPVLQLCLREAVWGLDLPAMFNQSRSSWAVRL
ncbi:MAG: VWA domain-containing protein [Nannocystaceae bacterium]